MRRIDVAPGAIGVTVTGLGGYAVCFSNPDKDSGSAAEICPGVGAMLRK